MWRAPTVPTMTYWRSAPPGTDELLGNLADLLLACRDTFHEIADRYHWEPRPGSGAFDDAAALPSDPGVPKTATSTGHRMIRDVVQVFLVTAAGHLGGLASLYRSGEVMFAAAPLVRAVLENCAHVVWLLDDASEVSPEDRLARAYLEELTSAKMDRDTWRRLHGHVDESVALHLVDVKAQIRERFPDAVRLMKNDPLIHGQELPSLRGAVVRMFEISHKLGGTIDGPRGAGVYDLYSNLTHPTVYPVRRMRRWSADAEHGHMVADLSISLDDVVTSARAALAAFYNSLNYATTYFGWDEALNELTATIDAKLPGFFVD